MIAILNIKYKKLLDKYKINTPLRLAHFFAQIEHESGFKPIEENLNYSIKRMLHIFKNDFDTNRDKWLSDSEKNKARGIYGSPEKIANFVYANQNGNGDENSGDGYKYRGRGFIQITGRYNYEQLSKDTGIDYANNPDWLLREEDSMISALWFWKSKNLNLLADKDDLKNITRRINGGYNGLKHREELLKEYKKVFFI